MTTETRKHLIHDCTVTGQKEYGKGYYVMELRCPELAATIGIGQFVNVRVRGEYNPLLRRPFSVFDVLRNRQGEPEGISLLYHTVGVGTGLMARMQVGAELSLLGPLGLEWPEPAADCDVVLMVGGGIGLAPFLLQAQRYLSMEPKRELVLIAGARSERDLKYMNLFGPSVQKGLEMMLCTEDGSLGIKGRVTEPLRGELEARLRTKQRPMVYTCGPTPMMEAVSRLCKEFDVPGVASLESVMACGYGVCNGCVTRVEDTHADGGFRYVKTCTYGPALDCHTLLWD